MGSDTWVTDIYFPFIGYFYESYFPSPPTRERRNYSAMSRGHFLNQGLSLVQAKGPPKILYVLRVRRYVRIEGHEFQFARVHVGNNRGNIVPCRSAPRFL